MRDAFGEGKVIKRIQQICYWPVDLQNFIDRTRVSRPSRLHQPEVVRRNLRVLQPGAEEEVAPPKTERSRVGGRFGDDALHLDRKLRGGTFIGVEQEHPWVLERHGKRDIAMRCVVVERPRVKV